MNIGTKSNTSVRLRKIGFIGCAIAITLFFIVAGIFDYPIFGSGSQFYFVPAINLSQGKPFTNEMAITSHLDTDDHLFLMDVPLYERVISLFMPRSTPHGVSLVLGFLRSLVYLLVFFAFYRLAQSTSKTMSGSNQIIIILSSLGLASSFFTVGQRSDLLVQLFLTCGILASLYLHNDNILPYIHGILLGFAGATHLVGGTYCALMLGAFYSYKYQGFEAFKKILNTFSIAVLTFAGILEYLGNGFYRTFQYTILGEGRLQTQIELLHSFNDHLFLLFRNGFADPSYTFYGGIVILAAYSIYHILRRLKDQKYTRGLCAFFIGLFVAFALFQTIIQARFYQFYAVAPIFFCSIVYYLTHFEGRMMWKLAAVSCILLSSLGFLWHSILFGYYLKDGVKLTQARSAYVAVMNNPMESSSRILSESWFLTSDYSHYMRYETAKFQIDEYKRNGYNIHFKTDDTQPTILIVPQFKSGLPSPHASMYTHCTLRTHNFVSRIPSFFSLKISHLTPTYSFAVYDCNFPT